ncbi:HEAT repeat domain-containing protein [Fulvivirgaceae bacterium BMA12]|uniref:HEAT repeat domain-containing protein n=1 Tax=Agaribacillus aureus TaxID=3051825 RepID=A0ABT8LCV7_9BACT|nr:HEAT repeat domain-containing protein [Fulvivirgaceae bacterium BMA12]
MDTSDLTTMLIDYIDGKLDRDQTVIISKKIEEDAEVAKEYHRLKEVMGIMQSRLVQQPDKSLEAGFMSMLEDEIIELDHTLEDLEKSIHNKKSRIIGLNISGPWQIAASVILVMIGAVIGMYVIKSGHKEEISSLKKEIDATKAVVIRSLEDQSSASQRIMGVNAAFELSEADDEIIAVLVSTMNKDNNINVRLAAIEALYRFSNEPAVKDAFIKALTTEKEPVIQMTLINILVNLKENRAINNMQKIIDDVETIKSVKDEAQLGIFKLS